nr:MAG TPA: hypothetical protein [Caudoviricetes sp.]DAR70468.1 MAG TPA: hypothetical protein [Caudoviricetes sp.]DAW93935.1 MAG TPA: hypothetical protein [Caudoviricetes sp.]
MKSAIAFAITVLEDIILLFIIILYSLLYDF